MKRVAIRGVIFFVAVSVTLLGLEGVVRVLHAHTNLLSIPIHEPSTFSQFDEELVYVPSPNFGPVPFRVEHVQYDLVSNEFGCFDRPYENEDPYILLMGDSFSHHLASVEDKWGSVLEREVDTRVVQCGVSAYSTAKELLFAKRIVSQIGKAPKLIVVGYFLNDFSEERNERLPASIEPSALERLNIVHVAHAKEDGEEDTVPFLNTSNSFTRMTRWLYDHFLLVRIARIPTKTLLLSTPFLNDWLLDTGALQKQAISWEQMLLYSQIKENSALQKAWEAHRAKMTAFKEFADEQGAELLFVIIPWKFQVYDFFLESVIPDPTEREDIIAQPAQILQEAFAKDGSHSFDLLPGFREQANLKPRKYLSGEKDLFFRFDLHWSPNGQELAGLLTAEYIKEHDLLKSEKP